MAGARQVIYSGQGFSPRGEKGRYALPPALRKLVTESSDGRVLCIGKHDRWDCLTGFGLSRKEELEAELARLEERAIQTKDATFDPDLKRMQMFGFQEIPFDSSGRFVLPEYLAGLAGLDDALYFHGAGAFFTLWNPEKLYQMGAGWEGAQAACRSLSAEARARKA